MCPDEYQIAAFLDHGLSSLQQAEIEAHIDTCPSCLEKVFFLQKALSKESAFLPKTTSSSIVNRLKISVLKEGFKILKSLGKIEARELSLSFRDSHALEKALSITLSRDLTLILSKKGESIVFSSSSPSPLTIINPENQRLLFSGTLNTSITLPLLGSYQLQSNHQSFLLELSNV